MLLQPISATFILSLAETFLLNEEAITGDTTAPAMSDPEYWMNFRLEVMGIRV